MHPAIPAETRVVCAGDSITRGQLSVDYLKLLNERPIGRQYTFVRAGVNGDFAYNLLQRLDEVIKQRPKVVTVLIGTNDARASLSGTTAEAMMKRKQLPTRPTIDWYRTNLTAIVERLRNETDARVALLSIPALGQGLESPAMHNAAAYSEVIKQTAQAYGTAYLPVFEQQVSHLRHIGAQTNTEFRDELALVYRAVLQRIILRRSFDTVAYRRGLELTTDFVHQNSRGATIIADQIDNFLQSLNSERAADSQPVASTRNGQPKGRISK